MNKPIITVIVPVYNVESYLSQCMDSILCQTYSNIEIICVNDGSTDDSGYILEEYARKDSRIRIVNKKNGGLSSARNAGMKVARGEFYSFIDSDDWVAPDMIEKLYKNIVKFNSDISICAVHMYDEKKNRIDDSNPYYTLGYFDETFDNRSFSYKDVKPFIMDVCVMAWNKLYRRSFIDACNAQFPDGYIFEDGPFFFSVFFKTNKVSIVRDFLYYYRINRKGSIIHKAGKKFLNIIDVIEMMYNSIKDLPDYEEIKPVFFQKKVEDLVFRYETLKYKYRASFVKKLRNESSLANDELFPPSLVKGQFRWMYFMFCILKNEPIFSFEINRFKMRLKYKIMYILYHEAGYYSFSYKNISFKLKKRAYLFDIYYYQDKIYVIILYILKFNIPFKYSELEKLTQND